MRGALRYDRRPDIILEVKAALEKKDILPILKWVRRNDEAEIIAAFAKSCKITTKLQEITPKNHLYR